MTGGGGGGTHGQHGGSRTEGPSPEESQRSRNVGVGCFTAFMGLWSGGMFGVLVAKIVDAVTRAPSCPGIPSCNWAAYFGAGALIGALTLPTLVLMRLRRGDAGTTTDHSPRG